MIVKDVLMNEFQNQNGINNGKKALFLLSKLQIGRPISLQLNLKN